MLGARDFDDRTPPITVPRLARAPCSMQRSAPRPGPGSWLPQRAGSESAQGSESLRSCVPDHDRRGRGPATKSDLRNHQAIVQPRLYDSLMVTQITLKTEGPHGLPSGRRASRGWSAISWPYHLNRLRLRSRFTLERREPCANAAARQSCRRLRALLGVPLHWQPPARQGLRIKPAAS